MSTAPGNGESAPRPHRASPRPSEVAKIIQAVREVPALPEAVNPNLLALDTNAPDLPERVLSIIAREPLIAAQVIRLANSLAYAGEHSISDLPKAIHRVGARNVVSTVIRTAMSAAIGTFARMKRLTDLMVLEGQLMMSLSRKAGDRLGLDPEQAYLCGILHDIGHAIMIRSFGSRFEAHLDARWPASEIASRELEEFGIDHQTAGRILCNHWRLPFELSIVVAAHHVPREMYDRDEEAIQARIALVAIADHVSRAIAETRVAKEDVEIVLRAPAVPKLMDRLGLTPNAIHDSIPEARAGAQREDLLSQPATVA